jgi:hypothetical protein
MTPQQAQANIAALRQAIARFNAVRSRTAKMLEAHPELADRVRELRDNEHEQLAVESLVDLNRLILQRDPTAAELQLGVPGDEALGFLPLLPLVAIGGGAWTVTSIMNYLTAREETVQRQLGMTSSWSDVLGQAFPFLIVGAIGFGGYYLYKHSLGSGKTRRPPPSKISGKTGRPALEGKE